MAKSPLPEVLGLDIQILVEFQDEGQVDILAAACRSLDIDILASAFQFQGIPAAARRPSLSGGWDPWDDSLRHGQVDIRDIPAATYDLLSGPSMDRRLNEAQAQSGSLAVLQLPPHLHSAPAAPQPLLLAHELRGILPDGDPPGRRLRRLVQ